ncbi:hypothetical protein KIPB_007809, partial [Kipferlia bialata]
VYLYIEAICTIFLALYHLQTDKPFRGPGQEKDGFGLVAGVTVVYLLTLVGSAPPMVLIAAPLCAAALLGLVGHGWYHSVRRAGAMQHEISSMNTAVQSALSVFFSAVPKATQHYVTQGTQSTPPATPTPAIDATDPCAGQALSKEQVIWRQTPNARRALGETLMRGGGEGSGTQGTAGTGVGETRGNGVPSRDPTPAEAQSVCAPASLSDTVQRVHTVEALKAFQCTLGPARGHGLIKTEADAVVAFIGVTTKFGSVPVAAYIRDLSILTCLIDDVIAETQGMMKVKSFDGCVIVRQFGRMGAAPKTPLDEQILQHQCLSMCRMIAAVSLGVSALRESGIPLHTVEGIRAGVACGRVMCGVLGTHELMADIFGDTVNTAARLMGEAGVFETLVTEKVAQYLQAPLTPALRQPELRHVSFAVSPPISLLLKGKGACPVRRVYVAESDLPRFMADSAPTLRTSTLAVLELGSIWSRRIMSASAYMSSLSARQLMRNKTQLTPPGTPPRDATIPRLLCPVGEGDPAVQAIFNTPWTVIRASFTAVPGITGSASLLPITPPVQYKGERNSVRHLMFGITPASSGVSPHPLTGAPSPEFLSRSLSRPSFHTDDTESSIDSYLAGCVSTSHGVGERGTSLSPQLGSSHTTRTSKGSPPSRHTSTSMSRASAKQDRGGRVAPDSPRGPRRLRAWQIPASNLSTHAQYNPAAYGQSTGTDASDEWVRQPMTVVAATTDTSDSVSFSSGPQWSTLSQSAQLHLSPRGESSQCVSMRHSSLLPNSATEVDTPLTLTVSADAVTPVGAEGVVMWGLRPGSTMPTHRKSRTGTHTYGGDTGREREESGSGETVHGVVETERDSLAADVLSAEETPPLMPGEVHAVTDALSTDSDSDDSVDREDGMSGTEGTDYCYDTGTASPKDRGLLVLDTLILNDIEHIDAAFTRGTPSHILTTQHRAHIIDTAESRRRSSPAYGLPSRVRPRGALAREVMRRNSWYTCSLVLKSILSLMKRSSIIAYRDCAYLTFHDAGKTQTNRPYTFFLTVVQAVLCLAWSLRLAIGTEFRQATFAAAPVAATLMYASTFGCLVLVLFRLWLYPTVERHAAVALKRSVIRCVGMETEQEVVNEFHRNRHVMHRTGQTKYFWQQLVSVMIAVSFGCGLYLHSTVAECPFNSQVQYQSGRINNCVWIMTLCLTLEVALSNCCLSKILSLRACLLSVALSLVLSGLWWRIPPVSPLLTPIPLLAGLECIFDLVLEHIKLRTSIMCLAEALAAKVLVTRVASGR